MVIKLKAYVPVSPIKLMREKKRKNSAALLMRAFAFTKAVESERKVSIIIIVVLVEENFYETWQQVEILIA